MIKEIERLVLNKYSNLTKEKQSEYFIKEVKKLIDNNVIIKANINEIIYYIKQNKIIIHLIHTF